MPFPALAKNLELLNTNQLPKAVTVTGVDIISSAQQRFWLQQLSRTGWLKVGSKRVSVIMGAPLKKAALQKPTWHVTVYLMM